MKQKKVVIIGGGFAGSIIAKSLEKFFNVTLIDKKDFFEFTPGILRAIVDPTHLQKLQVQHRAYLQKTNITKGVVTKVTNKHVEIKSKKIPFDYLVIASGSSYHTPIKAHNVVNSSNAKLLQENYKKIKKSKKILVVGGGIVGVELACEIGEAFQKDIKNKKKEVILVHSKSHLMPKENKKACHYAEKILKKYGVDIHFEKRFDKKDTKHYDLVFLATGIKPNTAFLPKQFLSEKGFIKIKETLQLEGQKHIFAAGDAINIAEEKLAQAAESHAHIIIKNIQAIENKKKLMEYISKKRLKIISLGKKRGIITYKNFTLTGIIPGFLKGIFEWFYVKTL